jgi:hypothetical protein
MNAGLDVEDKILQPRRLTVLWASSRPVTGIALHPFRIPMQCPLFLGRCTFDGG